MLTPPRGHAAAAEVDRVERRCRCARPLAATRERDALGLGGVVQQLEHPRVDVRAALEHGPRAERVAADLVRRRRPGARSRGSRRRRSRRRGAASRRSSRSRRTSISSCTAATATTSPGRAAGLGHEPRRLEGDEAAQAVVHRARDAHGRWAARWARRRCTATSPIRTSARASSPSFAPTSMCRSFSSATFLRSSCFSRWIGFLPITPVTTPSRVASSTRWPTRICGSQPPTPTKRRKPSSSMCVTMSPISSMWPTTASRRAAAGARHARQRGAHDVDARLGEGPGLAAEHGRRRRLVAGRAGGGEQRAQDGRDGHDAAG